MNAKNEEDNIIEDKFKKILKSFIDLTVEKKITWKNIKQSMILDTSNDQSIVNITAFNNYVNSHSSISNFEDSYYIHLSNIYCYIISEKFDKNFYWKVYTHNDDEKSFVMLPTDSCQDLLQRLINAIIFTEQPQNINDTLDKLKNKLNEQKK